MLCASFQLLGIDPTSKLSHLLTDHWKPAVLREGWIGLDREALEEFSSSSFLPCIPPEDANLWYRNINTASHFQGPSTHRLQILDYHSDKLQVLTSSETESLGLGSILGVTHRRQGGRALWVWLLS